MQKSKNKRNKYAGFIGTMAGIVLALCAAVAALVIIVDPFFHYHAPLSGFPYLIDDQLTQNPGIAKYFEYDSISIGSSVSVNFKVSWFDELFGTNTAKLPYNGAYPKDIANAFKLADKSGKDLKAVFWGIDIAAYSADPEEIKYPLPEYLYDKNPLNDVFYVFNKDVIVKYIVEPYINKALETDRDEYYCSAQYFSYGRSRVLSGFEQIPKTALTTPETKAQNISDSLKRLEVNWEENLVPMIESRPDTIVYVYFPPRSVLYWYEFRQKDQMDTVISEEKKLAELLLAYDNVKLYYFEDDTDTITDFDNYNDTVHFSFDVSRQILEKMAAGEDELTAENFEETIDAFGRFINEYDYDSLFLQSE